MITQSHLSTPSQPASRPSIWIARTLWCAVVLLVAAILVEMLPHNLVQTRHEWSVQEAMDAAARYTSFVTYVYLVVAVEYLATGVYLAAGLVIFWRGADDPFAIFVSATLIMFALPFGISGNMTAWRLPQPFMALAPWLPTLLGAATLASFVLLLFLFPNGRFVPRWMSWIAVLLVGLTGVATLAVLSPAVERFLSSLWQAAGASPDEASWILLSATLLIAFLSGLVAQVYRYWCEVDPLRRQQTKWVVWGLSAPLLGLLLNRLLDWIIPEQSLFHAIDNLVFPLILTLIPLSILFSILRYHLWAIDLWINRTLVYGSLSVLIALAYILLVGVLSMVFPGRQPLARR